MKLGRAIVWLAVIAALGYGISIVIQKTGSVTDSLGLRNAKDDGLYRPESVVVYVTPLQDGVMYSGAITLLNPCYEMPEPKVRVKNPEFVTLEFTAEPGSDECVQMIEEREFSADAAGALSTAVVDVVFNGRKISVTKKLITD